MVLLASFLAQRVCPSIQNNLLPNRIRDLHDDRSVPLFE